MTTIALGLKRSSLLSPLPLSFGRSDEARTVDTWLANACEHLLEPISTTRVIEEAARELNTAAAAAAEPGWDGYGACAVEGGSYLQAVRFLTLLPTLTPTPTISIDPDGEVSVSWDLDRNWMFSVSLSRSGRLSYAGLFGSNRAYGTEWLGSEIPNAILDSITRVYAGATGSHRTEPTS
jgi:hypothetical protein